FFAFGGFGFGGSVFRFGSGFFGRSSLGGFVRGRFCLAFLRFLLFRLFAAFGGNAYRNAYRNFAVKFYGNGVLAGFFDRVFQNDLAAVEFITFCLQGVGYVHRRDRTKKRSAFAGFAFERKRDVSHLISLCLCRRTFNGCPFQKSFAFEFDLADVAFGRKRRKSLRQKVVSGVTRSDLDDVAAAAERVNILT